MQPLALVFAIELSLSGARGGQVFGRSSLTLPLKGLRSVVITDPTPVRADVAKYLPMTHNLMDRIPEFLAGTIAVRLAVV